MKVRVLDAALDDIDELLAWVEAEHGLSFALKTRKDLFATFELFGDFPQMGRIRTDVTTRSVRFFLMKPYWIVYEPGDPCSSIVSCMAAAT